MAPDISLMRSDLTYNKCAQSPVFPQLCTDPSGRDRGFLLTLPNLFPSDILSKMLHSMLTISGCLSHTCYFFPKGRRQYKHLFGLLSTAPQTPLCTALQFCAGFPPPPLFLYMHTPELKIFLVHIFIPQGKL